MVNEVLGDFTVETGDYWIWISRNTLSGTPYMLHARRTKGGMVIRTHGDLTAGEAKAFADWLQEQVPLMLLLEAERELEKPRPRRPLPDELLATIVEPPLPDELTKATPNPYAGFRYEDGKLVEPPHEARSCGCQVNAPHICGKP